jgi:hypothetical protein
MGIAEKLAVLQDVTVGTDQFDRVVDKLLEGVLARYRQHLVVYERELKEFEQQYQLDSASFYQRFEAGALGDAMDFFEWSGLYELKQALAEKIRKLEQAL